MSQERRNNFTFTKDSYWDWVRVPYKSMEILIGPCSFTSFVYEEITVVMRVI